ncbi:MAG: site-2 protease family protein [Acidimicrobiia bacterium]
MPAPTPPPPHRWSFVVARISGIDIRVHATFLLLVALFAYAAPEPGVAGALASVAWLLAVFGSVVVHELAHSLTARRRGAQVHEILLFPLGGISKLERLPESAADEFAIAIVGPLTSLGIAAGAALLCVGLGGSLLPIDLIGGSWLARIAWLNLILGAFNLLPAFPLDGGRVLRAILERRHDLIDATQIATRVGHAFAVALIAVGVLFDFWLALIGIFVYLGATAEGTGTIIHAQLRGHTVRELVRPVAHLHGEPAQGVSIDEPLDVGIVARLERSDGSLPVVDGDGHPVGLLLLSDVKDLLEAEDRRRQAAAAGSSDAG